MFKIFNINSFHEIYLTNEIRIHIVLIICVVASSYSFKNVFIILYLKNNIANINLF